MSEYEYLDEYTDLLGAYALDAVEADERDRIELHLVDCPRCRAEVAEHREVAAFLAHSGADAPEGVWDRIASELSPAAPPMRLTLTPPVTPQREAAPVAALTPAPRSDAAPANVSSLAARRSIRTRTFAAVLAAAAVIVAVLGFVSVDKNQQLNRMESAMSDASLDRMANNALARSDLQVRLKGEAGSAQAVVEDSGHGYLMSEDLPDLPDGSVYQLWGKVDGTTLSLGTFGGGSGVVPFNVDPSRLDDISLLAVTLEQGPGVIASQNPAILAGAI